MGCFFFEFCQTIIEEKIKSPTKLKLGYELCRLGTFAKFPADSGLGNILGTSFRGSCAAFIAAVARPSLVSEESVRHTGLSQCLFEYISYTEPRENHKT